MSERRRKQPSGGEPPESGAGRQYGGGRPPQQPRRPAESEDGGRSYGDRGYSSRDYSSDDRSSGGGGPRGYGSGSYGSVGYDGRSQDRSAGHAGGRAPEDPGRSGARGGRSDRGYGGGERRPAAPPDYGRGYGVPPAAGESGRVVRPSSHRGADDSGQRGSAAGRRDAYGARGYGDPARTGARGAGETSIGEALGNEQRRSRLEERSDQRGRRGTGPGGGSRGPGSGGRRGSGPGDNRPARRPKTGYHRFFDYPRTNKTGFKRFLPSFRQILSGCLTVFFLACGVIGYAYATAPAPDAADVTLAQATSYEYANGSSIVTIGTDRHDVDLAQVPMVVRDSIMSAEERNYYHDAGVSPSGIARAAYDDLKSNGGSLSGGSTITQQYVRNAYLTLNQTFSRKYKEILISIKIARKYSKDQILQDYLNTVTFGRNAYGIDAAAQQYFGVKSVSDITDPSRAAYLAALVQSPNNFAMASDPTTAPATKARLTAQLKARWVYVMQGLLKEKWITPAQYAAAKFPTPIPPPGNQDLGGDKGYMRDAANSYLTHEHSIDKSTPTPDEVTNGGYTVVTTFDPTLMADAQKAVQDQLYDNPKLDKNQISGLTPALAAVDPNTGDVKAFYSGKNYTTSYYDNAIIGQEQPGSTFKAFTLAAALNQGISPDSVFNGNSPFEPLDPSGQPYPDKQTGGLYKVPNEDDVNYGNRNLYYAAQQSINTIFVRLEMKVGLPAVYQMLQNCGITMDNTLSLAPTEPSLTLGTASVSPMQMADSYAVMANGGTYHPAVLVTKVLQDGKVVWQPKNSATPAMPANVAAGVTSVFHTVVTSGTGTNAIRVSGLTNIAGKTGTTDSNLSAWFDGYSQKLAVAVGMWKEGKTSSGTNGLVPLKSIDNGGTRVNGADYPTDIWGEFMKLAGEHIPDIDPAFPPFSLAGLHTDDSQEIPTPSATPTPTPSTTPTPKSTPTPSMTPTAPPTSSVPTLPVSTAPTTPGTPPTSTCQPSIFDPCSGGNGKGGKNGSGTQPNSAANLAPDSTTARRDPG